MTQSESSTVRPTLASLVERIHHILMRGEGVLSTGDVADLRRMDPWEIRAAGFYKLVGAVLDPDLPGDGPERDRRETRWAAAVVGLAHLGEFHRPGVRLGSALVQAGFSDQRFVRLLRADSERIVDEVPTLARFLAAKGTPADFTDAVRLLLSSGRSDEESVRRRIARDYYGALHQAESTHG